MISKWRTVRLGDHCVKVGSGATPKGGKESYLATGPCCLIRSQNIYNDGFRAPGLAFISLDQARKLDGVAVSANDILLNITGDSVARVCLALAEFMPARVNQHVAIIRPDPKVFDSRFLRYFLVTPYQQDVMLSLAAAGATRNALTKGMIENFVIPCPPLQLQIEIAECLSALDDQISLLQETNATLEAIAQALFKSWFVDFDPVQAKKEGREPEGMDLETGALFPDGFEGSKIGQIPTGWKVASLAELMDIAGGTQPPASKFIDLPCTGYVRLIQIRDYETDAHLTFVPDTGKLRKTNVADIMIARYGASVGRICWGLEGAYNVALVRVICDSNAREYLRSYLKTDAFQGRLAALSGRSAQAGFNKGDIASFSVVVPPINLLCSYQNIAWSLRQSILTNIEKTKTLAALRDTLLPRLVSGQVGLPEAKERFNEALTGT